MTVANEREALHKRIEEEGMHIMIDVFDIILDRDEATVEQIMAYLDDEDRDVFTCYERFIAKGIDRLSDHMAEVQGREYSG